jgi:hypothetical protein
LSLRFMAMFVWYVVVGDVGGAAVYSLPAASQT